VGCQYRPWHDNRTAAWPLLYNCLEMGLGVPVCLDGIRCVLLRLRGYLLHGIQAY
jgi:hypothetical protein